MKGDQIDREGWSIYLKYTFYRIPLSGSHIETSSKGVSPDRISACNYVIYTPYIRLLTLLPYNPIFPHQFYSLIPDFNGV